GGGLLGGLLVGGAGLADGVDDVEPVGDAAEERVAGLEATAALVAGHDEELAPVRVRPGVGHGHRAGLVLVRARELVPELVAGAAGSALEGVAALDDEVGHDP